MKLHWIKWSFRINSFLVVPYMYHIGRNIQYRLVKYKNKVALYYLITIFVYKDDELIFQNTKDDALAFVRATLLVRLILYACMTKFKID
jgi:hypothetical protein